MKQISSQIIVVPGAVNWTVATLIWQKSGYLDFGIEDMIKGEMWCRDEAD